MKNELKNGILIAIVVVLIIVVVYFTTAIFMTGEIGNKKSNSDKTTTANSTSLDNPENMIVAGRVFNQAQGTYMVLIFSKDDASEDLTSAISGYNKEMKLYKVNTDETVNKYVISDTDNVNPTSSRDLKVKKMALLTISNGIVSSYISDEEQIINVLK